MPVVLIVLPNIRASRGSCRFGTFCCIESGLSFVWQAFFDNTSHSSFWVRGIQQGFICHPRPCRFPALRVDPQHGGHPRCQVYEATVIADFAIAKQPCQQGQCVMARVELVKGDCRSKASTVLQPPGGLLRKVHPAQEVLEAQVGAQGVGAGPAFRGFCA
jgi:hypothetical protein